MRCWPNFVLMLGQRQRRETLMSCRLDQWFLENCQKYSRGFYLELILYPFTYQIKLSSSKVVIPALQNGRLTGSLNNYWNHWLFTGSSNNYWNHDATLSWFNRAGSRILQHWGCDLKNKNVGVNMEAWHNLSVFHTQTPRPLDPPLFSRWQSAHCSLLVAHCSLLTAHCSLSLFIHR